MVSPTEATSSTFLSTPSARWATLQTCATVRAILISIHALREEGDQVGFE